MDERRLEEKIFVIHVAWGQRVRGDRSRISAADRDETWGLDFGGGKERCGSAFSLFVAQTGAVLGLTEGVHWDFRMRLRNE